MNRHDKRQKAMLRQRMLDVLYGAHGGCAFTYDVSGEESAGIAAELGLDTLGRWIGAMQANLTFASENQQEYVGAARSLEHFDDFEGAVDWLFEIGVRA